MRGIILSSIGGAQPLFLNSTLPQSHSHSHSNFRFLPYHSSKTSTTFKLFVSTESPVSNSDAVISLFADYGFSSDQADCMFHKYRRLLSAAPETNIRPKLDYLLSFGYSRSELATLISCDPHLLGISLERRLIHNLNLLKSLLGSEDLVKKAISRSSRLLRYNLEKSVMLNVETYRGFGVPDKRIVQALVCFSRTMTHNPDTVIKVGNELKKLGVDPSQRAFIVGINAKIAITEPAWERKKSLYIQHGWSEVNFIHAFLKRPNCMLNSEGKIEKMMTFFVQNLGWDPVYLSEKPVLIDLSLEKRVVPRCSVLNVLAERGVLGGMVSLPTMLIMSVARFEEKYVVKFMNDVPAVIPAYQERNVVEFKALLSWSKWKKTADITDRDLGFSVCVE